MYDTNYNVDILINNKPIRQFPHDKKLFIEARHGQEYSIRIKNSTWQRILAICSIDGLDVLTGKTASENSVGYVINGYNSITLDGFRVSNEKVAKFVFGTKGGSYAKSKEDGSEKNVGVIAVRLFQEKLPPPPMPPTEIHHHHHHDHYKDQPWNWPLYGSSTGNPPPSPNTTIWCDSSDSLDSGTQCCDWMERAPTKGPMRSATGKTYGAKITSHNLCSATSKKLGFDIGTHWGEAKESRVTEVEFEKGFLTLTTNIYYASRQSLIEMGVPLGNEKQVSFPEPFPADSKYAKPPKNWQG